MILKLISGNCVGLVVQTGSRTLFGRISGLIALSIVDSDKSKNAFVNNKELKLFTRVIALVAVFFGLLFDAISYFYFNYAWPDCLLISISTIISNLPLTLLVTKSTNIHLAARKLAKEKCLLKICSQSKLWAQGRSYFLTKLEP
jgi:magnesium-transporting ATPase (P-type)